MPDIGGLIARLVELIGEVVASSSLRLGIAPTLTVLVVLLVLLYLVARPTPRWQGGDLGHLAGIGRAMALAAEAGSSAAISLGTAGIARAVVAVERLQTMAALPILAHVARAAARSGVPLEVSTNDPVAATIASAIVAEAHLETGTVEREARSRVVYLGEGRSVPAARALAGPTGVGATRAGATVVVGGLSEEGLLILDAMAAGATSTTFGTASAAQASSVLLEGDATLVGPELFQAPADVHATPNERAAGLATNRLIWLAVAVLVAGGLMVVLGLADPVPFLTGR
jgi:hypothetical protein